MRNIKKLISHADDRKNTKGIIRNRYMDS